MADVDDAELEMLALARLGLADRLASAPAEAVLDAQRLGLEALERHGLLRKHQVRAVRAYVSRHARACPCGRRVLLAEEGGAECPACGSDVTASGGAAKPRPQGTIGPGSRVGPLEVLERLGAGASGTVFRARHEALGRIAALKVIARAALDGRRRRRFEREVEALARLDHPGIVKVHAAYEHEGSLAFEMELVDGESLEDRLERAGALPWREAVGIVAGLARAIDHAHAQGVLHRDLKPGNVLLQQDGRALVADLGLSRLTDQSSSLTLAGTPVGTPCYMAPEAFAGESSPQLDVYGLGAILYQALTGRPPFTAESLPGLLHLVTRGQCPPTAAPGAPTDLEAVRARAMAVRPEQRYATAAELALDLERVLEGRATSASQLARAASPRALGLRRLALLALAGAAIALTVVIAMPAPPTADDARATPETLERALEVLTTQGDPRRDAALLVVVRAARRDGASLDRAVEAAITRDPTAPGLRLARALGRRSAGAPLVASDVAALASAAPALDAAQVDALALHALRAGLEGDDPARLAAARALVGAAPASRAAATVLGVEGCAQGDPALRDEASRALQRALPDARVALLTRALSLADRVGESIRTGGAPVDAARLLETDLRTLAGDARLARAVSPILAPLGPIMRAGMREEPLGDYVLGEPRRSLIRLLDAAGPAAPDEFLGIVELLRNIDPDTPVPDTPGWCDRVEQTGRRLLQHDPLVGGYLLELAANHRLWAPGAHDPGFLRANRVVQEAARRLVEAIPVASCTDLEQLIRIRAIHRATNDLSELEERLAASEAEPRPHLERALEHSLHALSLSRGEKMLVRSVRMDAEDVARLGLTLGRLEVVEPVLELVRRPAPWRAELVRRQGDPERARALAQAAHDAEPTSDALAALVLALTDLGRLEEARAGLKLLMLREAAGEPPLLELLRSAVLEEHLERAGER